MTNIRAMAAALALTIWMIMGADGLAEPAAEIRQEVWGLSLPIPMPAYVAKPAGEGPFPLVVMNHGESLDATARGFFPRAEFRDAALWFARQGYLVVAPVRPGFRTSSIDFPERGLYGIYFGEIGECAEANFRDPGLAIASIDEWTIDYLVRQRVARPKAIVIGQSGGGWGAVALSSRNPQNVRAIIAFAAGRGGHIDGKPNNNCAPDKLIDTAREFGKSARTPVLWIYARNDSYFGPELSKQMFEAFRSAGGVGEYHLVPDFGNDGHFLVDSADAIPHLVSDRQPFPGASPMRARITPILAVFFVVAALLPSAAVAQHGMPPGNETSVLLPPDIQNMPRGRVQLQGVAYSDWRKLCFKAEPNQVCRTTISGTINTGQEVLRVDLIEGDAGSARILIVLPGGLYLPAGVKIAIDDGEALQIPYMWSFSNVCVAAKSVSPDLIARMKSGRSMSIEAVDSGLLAVTATLPLSRFADASSAPTTLNQSLAK